MLAFSIEFFNWLRARPEVYRLQGTPYFWGLPDSREAYERCEAFLRCSGRK